MDFYKITKETIGKRDPVVILRPEFIVKNTEDLMVRGKSFYAVWDDQAGLWSTDPIKVADIIDQDLYEQAEKENQFPIIKTMKDFSTNSWDSFCKYLTKLPDTYHQLDTKITFQNTVVEKKDYISRRLPYSLGEGNCENYNQLMPTLFDPLELQKLEWITGAIISGDAKKIQKFIVLYGEAGAGKSTFLNILEDIFKGYCATYEAKDLTSNTNAFATAAFANSPLVAIQHDGDLSMIKDNSILNSIVSHENIVINEKFKSQYSLALNCILFMATNKPVKITDAKSGLIRRLIDVKPSGRKLNSRDYNRCMSGIKYELGAIAQHCLNIYQELGMHYYDDYKPLEMMFTTDPFFNFVEGYYDDFKSMDGITAKRAYELYKKYYEDNCPEYTKLALYKFREEFKNYWKEYKDEARLPDGTHVRNYFSGFLSEKFENEKPKKEEKKEETSWLVLDKTESSLDILLKDCPAQYCREDKEVPRYSWNKCFTKLKDLLTSNIHYVKPPENLIVIDFDLKDKDGNKSLERNLEAASKWPPTYAETSKSGSGIHLHYFYTGDVSELSAVYDDNIEIKVFTGGSSLRRKLVVCNVLAVATISSGLPLKVKKGDKLINGEQLKDEAHLINCVRKALRKEISPGSTVCCVNYIQMVTDKAYASGMKYDITSMRPEIECFALDSHNHSKECYDKVQEMHLKSDEEFQNCPELEVQLEGDPIVFFDIEMVPNLLLINWKIMGEGNPVVRMFNPSPEDVSKFMQMKLVGFNCRDYDNHIIYARSLGYSIRECYELSVGIISGLPDCKFGAAYNISYTDIYDFASAGNKKSLKKLEIEMGIHHQELGLPWDQPVSEELWPKVAEYCDNDVIATEAAFNYLQADWTARQILADLAGMSVNDKTNSLTTRIIFGKNKNPQSQFCYRDLSKPVKNLDPEVKSFLEEVCPDMMSQKHGEAQSLLPYFPGYKFENGVSTYRGQKIGEGGRVYAEPGHYEWVALLDIASQHPHSTIAECLFGPEYTKAYYDIVYGRVNIKHKAWDKVNNMLDGKLTPYVQKVINGEMSEDSLADALKTAINSVYGLTSAKFENPFKDPRNVDNIVAKRGALFMTDLKYEVQKRGFTVAHIKTDSIKIPNATPEIIQFVMEFGKKYGYTFEHEATYRKMCLVNDAVYIAQYAKPEDCEQMYGYMPTKQLKKYPKHKGWDATGTQFQIPYVFKTLFADEPIEFSDVCETFAVQKGELYLDMNYGLPDVSYWEKVKDTRTKQSKEKRLTKAEQALLDETNAMSEEEIDKEIAKGHSYRYIGRVGQFCPINSPQNSGILKRLNDGKYYNPPNSSDFRWVESEVIKDRNNWKDLIDMDFYRRLTDDAIETINKYTDFDFFVNPPFD